MTNEIIAEAIRNRLSGSTVTSAVEGRCDDDDEPRDDLLAVVFAALGGAAVGDGGHHERTGEAPDDGALTAVEARPSDDDRGDDVELHSYGAGGVAHRVEEGKMKDGGDADEPSGD